MDGTHQDRLVKRLRRKAIAGVAAADVFLETEYWTEHNHRFAHPPASPDDFHVSVLRPRLNADHPWSRGYEERARRRGEQAATS